VKLILIQYRIIKNYSKYIAKMAQNAISEELKFKIFLGACPQTPLVSAAFGNCR